MDSNTSNRVLMLFPLSSTQVISWWPDGRTSVYLWSSLVVPRNWLSRCQKMVEWLPTCATSKVTGFNLPFRSIFNIIGVNKLHLMVRNRIPIETVFHEWGWLLILGMLSCIIKLLRWRQNKKWLLGHLIWIVTTAIYSVFSGFIQRNELIIRTNR